jgi:hypothetical protein
VPKPINRPTTSNSSSNRLRVYRVDVDECAEGTDDCDGATQDCINTDPLFFCSPKPRSYVPKCGVGFAYDGLLGRCVGKMMRSLILD